MWECPVDVNGEKVMCTFLDPQDPKVPGEQLLVTPDDREVIYSEAKQAAAAAHWFLHETVRQRTLVERYSVTLAPECSVQIYNFWKPLAPEQIKKISGALAQFHSHLIDKRHWRLESIQILSEDEQNTKSGQPYRGRENILQARFDLFPASFEPGRYRNRMSCTWLEGAVLHETTHVCLEKVLCQAWEQNAAQLGWEKLPHGQVVEFPGGGICSWKMTKPSQCPTPYAAFQPDDDRAESVAALLYQSPLQVFRAKIVERFIRRPLVGSRAAPLSVRSVVPACLPAAPKPIYRLDHTRPLFQDATPD